RNKKGNVLILVFQCGGTDLQAAYDLAEDLAKAQLGDEAIEIIAFVPEKAPDAAAVVALGCSEIVMTRPKEGGEQKEATFGNFDQFLKAQATRPDKIAAWKQSLHDFAEKRGYPAVVIDALLDRNVELVRAKAIKDRNKTRLMTRQELDKEKAEWA